METEKCPVRASLPKTALPRIFFIDREIASGKYPATAQLAKKYETSVSTISRDIAFMKYSLDAPIEYSALRRGYYYSEPNYRLPAGFTTEKDLLALGMAKSILSLYKDTPLYEAVSRLLDSITAPLAAEGNSDWYENRIIVPQAPSAPIAQDIWDAITAGLKENRTLTFDYRGTWDMEYQPRRVRPYQLLFDNGAWYLYGYAEERKDIRVFSLFRMKNIALTGDHFTLPKDFDYRTSNSGSHFGVFAGQQKYHFNIGFYEEAALWIRERKWAEDQKIEGTDGGIIISFTSTQYDQVLAWVLSRGCNARPFAPEKLVKIWRDHATAMGTMAKEA